MHLSGLSVKRVHINCSRKLWWLIVLLTFWIPARQSASEKHRHLVSWSYIFIFMFVWSWILGYRLFIAWLGQAHKDPNHISTIQSQTWNPNLRVTVDCSLEVLITKRIIPTFPCLQYVSHLLCPFLKRQLKKWTWWNEIQGTRNEAHPNLTSELPRWLLHHPGSSW